MTRKVIATPERRGQCYYCSRRYRVSVNDLVYTHWAPGGGDTVCLGSLKGPVGGSVRERSIPPQPYPMWVRVSLAVAVGVAVFIVAYFLGAVVWR